MTYLQEIKNNFKKNWWKCGLTVAALFLIKVEPSEGTALGVAWFIPLIAAGISAVGAIGSAAMRRKGEREQVEATMGANAIMNQQWREQMIFEKREADRNAFNDIRNQFNQAMINNTNLRKSFIDIWGGR